MTVHRLPLLFDTGQIEMSEASFAQCHIYQVPALLMLKAFRSQERIVPMGNFRSRGFSFPGTFVPPHHFMPQMKKGWSTDGGGSRLKLFKIILF